MKEYAASGKLRESKKRYRDKHPERAKIEKLKKYNLTPEDYDNLLKEQNGTCKICNSYEVAKHQNGNIKELTVDHCHKSGKVRGLLCFSCNLGLGKFKDSVDFLQKAINYLKKD